MQLLSNAILTTLAVFLLLLPAFIVLRVLWGRTRGKIQADNLYSYLIWGLPLSLLIYTVYYEWRLYKPFTGGHEFPSEILWKSFTNDLNKNSSSDTSKSQLPLIRSIDSIYKLTEVNRYTSRNSFDTVRVLNYAAQDSSKNASNSTYIISKNPLNRNKVYTQKKFLKTIIDTIQRPRNTDNKIDRSNVENFKEERLYLIWQFLRIIVLCFGFGHLVRFLITITRLDRLSFFRLQSDLDYTLSGRAQYIEWKKAAKGKESREVECYVQVDLLCEIGSKIKIYRGLIDEYKVNNNCIDYLVLHSAERGNLLSEKNEKEESEILPDEMNIVSLDFTDSKIIASTSKKAVAHILGKGTNSTDFTNHYTDLYFIKIAGDKIYFSGQQIKNVNIKYRRSPTLSDFRLENKPEDKAPDSSKASPY